MINKKHNAYCLLMIAVLGWSGNLIFGRYLHDTIPPFGISFWRWSIALVILLVINGRTLFGFLKMVKRHFYQLFLLSLFGIILSSSFQYVGLNYTTATDAGIILTLMPIFIALCSEIIIKEKTTALQKVGMFIAFIGALVLMTEGQLFKIAEFHFNFGDLILIFAALMWGVYTALLKKYKLPCSPWELVQATSLISVILITIILFAQGKEQVAATFAHFSPSTLLSFLYLGVVAALLSLWGWNRGVAILGPMDAGVFLYLTPIFSAILASLILKERLHLYHLMGGAVIFTGVYLTLNSSKAKPS